MKTNRLPIPKFVENLRFWVAQRFTAAMCALSLRALAPEVKKHRLFPNSLPTGGLNLLALFALAMPISFAVDRPAQSPFSPALPGYRYQFPRDHFNHPDYQTEWWYYTGNLQSEDGRHFGFELTFFRQGVSRQAPSNPVWSVQDLYFAHLALSDIDGQKFYYSERLNRAGPGLAGVNEVEGRIWNGNWSAHLQGGAQQLQAIDVDHDYSFELHLATSKPPVIHGANGVSQKAAGEGHASHYISFTRLSSEGVITLQGKNFKVKGLSWMDHEFFTQQLGDDQVGWDWLSLQFDDNTELMLYRIRHNDGSVDPYSSGTYVDQEGRATALSLRDYTMRPSGESWTSPRTDGKYPIAWEITVPSLGLRANITASLKTQELAAKNKAAPSYWEGAIAIAATRNGAILAGRGYLEMTGYANAVRFSNGAN